MKYKYKVRGRENKHHKPHLHIRISDGTKLVLSLPDLTLMKGKIKSKDLKEIKNDLVPLTAILLKEFYLKNPKKNK